MAFLWTIPALPQVLKSPKWGITLVWRGKCTKDSLERWKPILKKDNGKTPRLIIKGEEVAKYYILQNTGGCSSQVHRKLFEIVRTRWSVVVDDRGYLLPIRSISM